MLPSTCIGSIILLSLGWRLLARYYGDFSDRLKGVLRNDVMQMLVLLDELDYALFRVP